MKIAAEAADVTLDGIRIRGPVQSRPRWEAEVHAADLASRVAWKAYADRLHSDVPSITGTQDEADDAPILQ